MASPHLVDPIKSVDPADALRLLIVDLQALADRLGLNKNRILQQQLHATQQHIFGPRTLILVMGEAGAVKRAFLERLLGPLPQVPVPQTGPIRLEHGAEAECSVSLPQGLTAVMPLEQLPDFLVRQHGEMPQQSRQTVRLPNAALAKGLAVMDTPALDTPAMADSDQWLAEAAAEADCWIFVMSRDHLLSERGVQLLRQLPRPCPQLDVVIEGAESLTGEARQAAREQLISTLRERCGLEEPRLTLLASPSAEGEAGSFWNGRFATFQSLTLLRGREHWLYAAQARLADTLGAVREELHLKLQGDGLDMQQARFRLGLRDLEVLRTRFHELQLLTTEKPAKTPSLVSAVIWPEGSAAAAREAHASRSPSSSPPTAGIEHPASEEEGLHFPPWRRNDDLAMREATTPAGEAMTGRPSRANAGATARGVHPSGHKSLALSGIPYRAAVHNLSAAVALLFKSDPIAVKSQPAGKRWRFVAVLLILTTAGLILGALWPAEKRAVGRGPGYTSQFTGGNDSNDSLDADFVLPPFEDPAKQPAPVAPSAPTRHNARSAPDHELIADPSFTDLGLSGARASVERKSPVRAVASSEPVSPARPSAAVRAALPQSSAAENANVPPRRQGHRNLLGLGRVWHWIRRGETVPQTNSTATN